MKSIADMELSCEEVATIFIAIENVVLKMKLERIDKINLEIWKEKDMVSIITYL